MLGPKEFAIMPWGWTPGERTVMKEIRECGFNLAGFIQPDHLDMVNDAGLECIVSESGTHVGDAEALLGKKEIGRRVAGLVKRVGAHPAVFGYYLRDEPGAKVYPGLRNWAEQYKKVAPDALAYINLFPNYASSKQMNVPTYDEYIESYMWYFSI